MALRGPEQLAQVTQGCPKGDLTHKRKWPMDGPVVLLILVPSNCQVTAMAGAGVGVGVRSCYGVACLLTFQDEPFH